MNPGTRTEQAFGEARNPRAPEKKGILPWQLSGEVADLSPILRMHASDTCIPFYLQRSSFSFVCVVPARIPVGRAKLLWRNYYQHPRKTYK